VSAPAAKLIGVALAKRNKAECRFLWVLAAEPGSGWPWPHTARFGVTHGFGRWSPEATRPRTPTLPIFSTRSRQPNTRPVPRTFMV